MNRLAALFNSGRYGEMESLARKLLEQQPSSGLVWKALGASLTAQNKLALFELQRATELMPDDAEAHYNLGNALKSLGRLDDAVASYRRVIKFKPDLAQAHNNLGNALKDLGQPDDAVACYHRALRFKPHYAEAHYNLGNALKDLGRLKDAVASYHLALKSKPDFAEAHGNLAVALNDLGQIDDAAVSYRSALAIRPDYVMALNNLALLLSTQGKSAMALDCIMQSLRIQETVEAKSIFVTCVRHLHVTTDDTGVRSALVRALTENWGRPTDLAGVCIRLLKLNPNIREAMTRVTHAWPQRLSMQDLLGSDGLTVLQSDPVLSALLNSARIDDIETERFLTMVRCALLEAIDEAGTTGRPMNAAMDVCCALANQCFINEYVFSHTDTEIRKADELRNALVAALDAGTDVPALWPMAVASYFPLFSIPGAARLLEKPWPDPVMAVLVQQIREPEEERQLRPTIPQATRIEDDVSLQVQNQYEDHPYPRWIKVAPTPKAKPVLGYLSQKFPQAVLKHHSLTGNPEVLIAGCGTGQHSIETARQLQGAKILAVDLSLNSLCYAKRKTRELGLTSIEYVQADLLNLGAIGRDFDLIESVGVLHHLADPWAGWRVLLSILRPGGFMKLGFYSELARRDIVKARAMIARQGYGTTANEIRKCRQYLLDMDRHENLGLAVRALDFFSTSSCRDLLFHVQEHRLSLTAIDMFLRENNLSFLGFELDPRVVSAYRLRFPGDQSLTHLDQWQSFENENPDTFFGMYQFWIQKPVGALS
jgi:Flp pilus assembly protein TadD/SAM-dependent methyltransferase